MEKERSGLRQRIEAAKAERRLERDIELTRQHTGLDIRNEADLRAAVGVPVSLSNLTAEQTEQINERNRETYVPSYNDLWKRHRKTYTAKMQESTRRARERAWTNHVASTEIGRLPVNHVTEDCAVEYVCELELGADMKRKLVQMFRFLSKRAIRAGHIRYCPFEDVTIDSDGDDDEIKFWHPETEYPLILKHARDDDAQEFFGFCMGAGPRPGEARRFDWKDVDMESERLIFRATKTNKTDPLPMTAEAKQWLQRRIDRKHGGVKPESGVIFSKRNGKPYARNYHFGLKGTLDQAGIKSEGRLRYGFRHGFCVALANEYFGDHWTRADAREMMRHSRESMTDRYYRVLKHRLDEKAAQSKPLTNPSDFERTNPEESVPNKKGTPRHGTPLLEAR